MRKKNLSAKKKVLIKVESEIRAGRKYYKFSVIS